MADNQPADAEQTQAPADAQQQTNAPAPEQNESEVQKVEAEARNLEKDCWNCGAKLVKGVCKECGFDRSLLVNRNVNG